jgi:hypothetical protein
LREGIHQAAPEGDPPWLVVLLVTVAALAAIGLTLCVWNMEQIETGEAKKGPAQTPAVAAEAMAEGSSELSSAPEEKPKPAASGPNTAKGSAAGGCALVLLILAKVLLRAPLMGGNLLFVGFVVLLVALIVLAVIFPLWFAIAKLRLGGPLGGLAVGVGALELVLFVGQAAVWGVVELEQYRAAERAGNNAEERKKAERKVEEHWQPSIAVGSILGWGLWSGLTAALFLKVRSLCPAPDAAEDAIVPIVR